MSSYGQMLSARCGPPCEVTCSQPFVDSRNEPCVSSCGDSRAIVYAPPVVVTFPGPIISSCPQESIVGTAIPEIEGQMGSGGGGMGSGGGGMGSGGGGMGECPHGGGSSCGSGIFPLGSFYRNTYFSRFGRYYSPFSPRGYYRYRYGNYGPF